MKSGDKITLQGITSKGKISIRENGAEWEVLTKAESRPGEVMIASIETGANLWFREGRDYVRVDSPTNMNRFKS